MGKLGGAKRMGGGCCEDDDDDDGGGSCAGGPSMVGVRFRLRDEDSLDDEVRLAANGRLVVVGASRAPACRSW